MAAACSVRLRGKRPVRVVGPTKQPLLFRRILHTLRSRLAPRGHIALQLQLQRQASSSLLRGGGSHLRRTHGPHLAGGTQMRCQRRVRRGLAGAPARRPLPPAVPAAVEGELRWLRRCVEAAAKGFAIGAGLKGGLALFSVLVRLRSRRRSPRSRSAFAFALPLSPAEVAAYVTYGFLWRGACRKVGAMTNEEAVVLALKETVRYGLFLGTFAGSYVSVDECIAGIWGRKRSAG